MKKLLKVLLLVGITACHSNTDCSYQRPADLNDGLKVSSLKEHQLDEVFFNEINQAICKGKYGNIHSLLIIEDNALVVEQYYNGWERDRLHFLASNTKSFNSILIGMAIEQGKINDFNQPMLDYFPDYKSLTEDSLKKKITIKDLLTNTSGFFWDEQSLAPDDPNNMGRKMDLTENWLEASLLLPKDTLPGKKYVYSGPNNIILSEILNKATGKDIASFAEQYLFSPLGINEYEWYQKNGVYDSGGGLKLRCRDIAKYGLLHLNKGKWNQAEIVSAEWIEQVLTPYIEIKDPFYGCYQWQMAKTNLGFNVWFIPGNGGQIINLIPALKMVIVVNADNRNISNNNRLLLQHLMQQIVRIHPDLQ